MGIPIAIPIRRIGYFPRNLVAIQLGKDLFVKKLGTDLAEPDAISN